MLLATFVNNLLSSFLPFQPWRPDWQLRIAGSLLSSGFLALIAVLFLHIAQQEISNRHSVMGSRARLIRRLAGWAAIGYLLLVPAQLSAGLRLLRQRAVADNQPLLLWRALRTRINNTQTEAEFRELLARLPDPPSLPPKLEAPLPQVKREWIAGVDARFAALQPRIDKARADRIQTFIGNAIRNTIQALVLAIGLAALAKQGRKHVLSGLLDRLFPFV